MVPEIRRFIQLFAAFIFRSHTAVVVPCSVSRVNHDHKWNAVNIWRWRWSVESQPHRDDIKTLLLSSSFVGKYQTMAMVKAHLHPKENVCVCVCRSLCSSILSTVKKTHCEMWRIMDWLLRSFFVWKFPLEYDSTSLETCMEVCSRVVTSRNYWMRNYTVVRLKPARNTSFPICEFRCTVTPLGNGAPPIGGPPEQRNNQVSTRAYQT